MSATGTVEDLAELGELDETILLKEIQARYDKEKIYTYIGDILIAVNPYRNLDIYGPERWKTYSSVELRRDLPPHLYAISDCAYQNLKRNAVNQCCVVSGESGAGKTESTKLLIEHVVQLCRQSPTDLHRRIVQVNPMLEAFGNAQTVINDNSSRFGKFIELNFDTEGQILGASISEYLLEKSRVVSHGKSERSFHIFYYLFAGLDKDQKEANLLENPNDHRILKQFPDEQVLEDKTTLDVCRKKWNELMELMTDVGFFDVEIEGTLAVLAAILHIADIKFIPDPVSDGVLIQNETVPCLIGQLIAVNMEDLVKALISNTSSIGSEKVTSLKNEAQANDGRDALSKALYSSLFSWIVSKINQLLQPKSESKSSLTIGILDIYGFENLKNNSFEQLCINIANEKLQFFFNLHIFQLELEEYKREGVSGGDIQFVDNQPLLDMLMGRCGLFDLIDEESRFPQGSDQTLLTKLTRNLAKHPDFRPALKQDPDFTIQHFAGQVTYSVIGFLEKNRDTLSNSMMGCLKTSTSLLVNEIFKNLLQDQNKGGGAAGRKVRMSVLLKGPIELQSINSAKIKKDLNPNNTLRGPTNATDGLPQVLKTLASHFKNSLDGLLVKLLAAEPHFIRCIKPNAVKEAETFDSKLVLQQLNYTGVLDTVKIRRLGYPSRIPFADFIKRYELINLVSSLKPVDNWIDGCRKLLEKSGLEGWQIGKTKVFLKYWQVEKLNLMLTEIGRRIVDCQRFCRAGLATRKLKEQFQLAAMCREINAMVGSISKRVSHLQDELHKTDIDVKRSSKPENTKYSSQASDFGIGSSRSSKDREDRYGRPLGFGASKENAETVTQCLFDETLDRVSSLSTDIWAKIYYMEKYLICGKLYLREWEVVLGDGSDTYNGTTIGVNSSEFEHLTEDSDCVDVFKSVGKGVQINRDDDGNVFMTKLTDCDVIIRGHMTPNENALCEEICTRLGRLDDKDQVKVFDIAVFKRRIAESLRSSDWDANVLAMLSVMSFSFVVDSATDSAIPCWACLINLAALDLLGKPEVLEEFKRNGHISEISEELKTKWASIDFHRMEEGYGVGVQKNSTR